MTFEEMIELLCQYGNALSVTKATEQEEEMWGCKYVLAYKGIICGSDLVSPEFVRDYIKRQCVPLRG